MSGVASPLRTLSSSRNTTSPRASSATCIVWRHSRINCPRSDVDKRRASRSTSRTVISCLPNGMYPSKYMDRPYVFPAIHRCGKPPESRLRNTMNGADTLRNVDVSASCSQRNSFVHGILDAIVNLKLASPTSTRLSRFPRPTPLQPIAKPAPSTRPVRRMPPKRRTDRTRYARPP